MADILKSKPVTDKMAEEIIPRIEALKAEGVEPTLAIIRVGQRPDDLSYERTAIKRATTLGITTRVFELSAEATQEELSKQIELVNQDSSIHGCLLFRPLPRLIDEKAICDSLAMSKDVDGISTASLGSVFTDSDEGFAPCTAAACVKMLDHYEIPIEGKHVVVVGRSLVIGKPVAMLLLKRNASVTICHSRTENLEDIMKSADIVICATGRAKAYGASCFKAGQVVLDVGINFDENGTLCGDVDYEAVEPIVKAITPVPGGIGSVTTSTTMEHTLRAAERAAQK